MKILGKIMLVTALMLTIGTNPVLAQGEILPGAADPSRIDGNNRPDTPPALSDAPPPQTPRSNIDTPEGADSVFLIVRGIQIDGVTVYDQEELLPYYQAVIGKKVSLKEIYDIALEIDRRYKEDGYILSQAFVPPQDVTEGYVIIQVREVRIGTVIRTGQVPESGIVENIVRRIQTGGAMNIHDMESDMLLLNDLPGVEATAVLKPAATPAQTEDGIVDLEITFDKEPYEDNNVTLNNHGSRYLGPVLGSARVGINHNVFLPHQQTELGGNISTDSDELKYGYFNHKIALNEKGTVLSLAGNFTRTQPGHRLKPLEIKGDSYSGSVLITHPILRTRQENLYLNAGFNYSHSETDILSAELFKDNLRVATLSLEYDSVDSWHGSNHVNFEISKGLGIFGASDGNDVNLSRAEGDPEFIKARLTLERLQRLTADWGLYGLSLFQFSKDPLLSSEEIGFGGQRIGRAYDSSEIIGDHGAAALLELQYNGLPPRLDTHFQPYFFYDIGKVWNMDAGSDNISASSAGLGMRLKHKSNINIDLSVALPLTKSVEAHNSSNDNAPRFFFSVSTTF